MKNTEKQQIASPCAACKIQRRKCTENCVLAPYFPRDNPLKFAIAHRIYGASNIIKLLQDLPTNQQREDAVTSIVYEATARLRDPVYGCTGTISSLQKQVSELQSQLATTQAELANVRLEVANLLSFTSAFACSSREFADEYCNDSISDAQDPLQLWDPVWS